MTIMSSSSSSQGASHIAIRQLRSIAHFALVAVVVVVGFAPASSSASLTTSSTCCTTLEPIVQSTTSQPSPVLSTSPNRIAIAAIKRTITSSLSTTTETTEVASTITRRGSAPESDDQFTTSRDKTDIKIHLNSSAIDLSHQNISNLSDVYNVTGNVITLNLSSNYLTCLSNLHFFGSTLKCLDVSFNQVANLQNNLFANYSNLQHLNMSHNAIRALADDAFKGLTSLQHLDLSYNRLETIAPGALDLPTLMRLVIASNPALSEDAALFLATGTRLQTMEAPEIGASKVPSSLTHSLRALHLSRNSIGTLRCGDMDSYPLLQLLDLASNDLAEIEDDALGRLEMLIILYLTNNSLQNVPRSLPEHLKVLHLESNHIAELRPLDLDLPQLEVLLLQDNLIQSIDDTAFSSLTSLVTLDLSHNLLKHLAPGIFEGPQRLRVLRLQFLNISVGKEQSGFALLATEHLIVLDLAHSPAIASQWLTDTAAMAAAHELQELDMSDCALEHIPRDLLHYLPQLRAMHLHGNRLNCTGLQWLAEWLRRSEMAAEEVLCNAPDDLWGLQLVDMLDLQSMATPKSLKKQHKKKKAQIELPILAVNSIRGNFIQHQSLSILDDSPNAGEPKEKIKDITSSQLKSPASISTHTNRIAGVTHPGMYLLILGVLCCVMIVLITITTTSRTTKRRRQDDLQQLRRAYDDRCDTDLIEVSALPATVADLW